MKLITLENVMKSCRENDKDDICKVIFKHGDKKFFVNRIYQELPEYHVIVELERID